MSLSFSELPPDPVRSSLPYSSDLSNSSNAMRHYVWVLRRRWRWIVAGVVLGMLGGLGSTYLGSEEAAVGTYFKATNTVIDGNSNGSGVNLQQAAFLLQSAEVQNSVAAKMNVPVSSVKNYVAAQSTGDVSAIDVTAISTDPVFAVRLADNAAEVLVDYVEKDQQRQYTDSSDAIIKKLDDLKAQRADLETQITRNPAQAALLRAELDSVVNQYRLTYEQLQSLANNGVPTASFSTLQPASPVQINVRGFRERLDANVNSRGSVTSGGSTRAAFVETDLGVGAQTSRATRALIGGLVGFILGLASAFIIDVWDDRLRRRDKVELVTALPVIAEVPLLPRVERQDNAISVLDAPRSRSAERYRSIKTTILFALDSRLQFEQPGDIETNRPGRAPVVLVTSPSPGEGKTTTTSNIASVFADSGSRTLVVDCDYRKPSIGKYLVPIPNVEHDDFPCRTRLNNLWFIPAPKSTGSPAETIQELRRIIERWRGYFDIVLLDTPPMLTTNDATDLLDTADHVVLVIRSGQTRTGPAERVASLLSRFRANVIGVVLNSCSAADMDSYYGYYYYYGGSGSRGYYGNRTPAATPAITEPATATATPQN